MTEGTLFIVATPIGHLDDITARALSALRQSDVILCEDTRVTRRLLDRYGIQKDTVAYHQHSPGSVGELVHTLLENGKSLALVTDAGTPGISDPGNELIAYLLSVGVNARIVPIPGPSAVIAALSICGFPAGRFLFLGFPPHKKRRKKFFEEAAGALYTTVFYESSHRIKKALEELAGVVSPKRNICVCRELTKAFETIYRGTMKEIVQMKMPEKGEFVIVVEGK